MSYSSESPPPFFFSLDMAATGTGKRSEVCNGEEYEEQEDDQKMEQFFAIIRNFREARNRRKDELIRKQREDHDKNKEKNKNKNKQKKMRRLDDRHDEQSNTWVPTFEPADFTEQIEFRRPPIIFPPSPYSKKEDKKQHKQEEEEDGLDLKLTL